MADPIGVVAPRDFSPTLRLLVFDPDVPDNEQVELVESSSADAGARYSEAIGTFLDDPDWMENIGTAPDLTGYATEEYVDEQMAPILAALDAIMTP